MFCDISFAEVQKLNLLSGGEGQTTKWIAENQAGIPITIKDDVVDVVASRGMTLWYDKKLKGEYQISYSVMFVMEGGEHDRLSDLNCFWGASDPESPKDFFKRAEWRDGDFGKYSYMSLFYVGYGGNKNSSTRFRRYLPEFIESGDRDKYRPIIKEYREAQDLLKLGEWMNVVITVRNGRTTYTMNGKELFNHPLEKGQDEGYFGVRLVRNHILLTNFEVKYFTKDDAYKYEKVIVEQEALATIDDKWGDEFHHVEYPTQYLKNVVEVTPGASIQEAIDEVNSKGGGVVRIMAGEHVVNKTIHIKSGVTIIGEGADKSFIVEGEGIEKQCLCIDVHSQVTDVVMKDFTLLGKDIGSVQGIFISGVNDARHQRMLFQNLVIKGWGSHGVHIKRTNNMIMDRCVFTENGSRNGLYHNLYFLYNKELLQSDCDFSNPVMGKGCKYTSCEFVLAQRCTIDNCIGNGIQADNEQTGYLFLHKYRVSGCGQVALWFPCEYYYGKFDYTEDPKYAPQNVILSRCEIVDNTWGAMWRVVCGKSYVINSHFANKKIDMGLLLCNVEMENSTFDKGNRIMDDLRKWPMDVHLLW